jgi:hydrogenase maturation protein HypF
LIGGELAVREPWRVAMAALLRAGCADLLPHCPLARAISEQQLTLIARLAANSWPMASGAGRLFEACGALLGLATRNSWEGEAAARLESLAASEGEAEPWPEVTLVAGARSLPSSRLLACAAQRLAHGEEPAVVARGFHATFCELAAALTLRVAAGETTVAIGGGCLVNRLLATGLRRRLENHGFHVLLPRSVPPGDGGLAYGQSVVAAVASARDIESPSFDDEAQQIPL